MTYELKYENGKAIYKDNEENRRIVLDEKYVMGMYEALDPPAIADEAEYKNAILKPCDGTKRLRNIALEKNAETACIIVSDVTRGVPTAKAAPYVVQELRDAGIKDENIIFIVALGVHRNSTNAEMKDFIGESLYGNIKIENHDPYTEESLVYLGETTRKTPVKVNKRAYECDIKVTIGKVELHEMAGFSGGRKSVLPGVSSEETILVNHRPEMIFNKGTGAGKLNGNPIHEDMVETARMFGVDFTVNFVVNNSQAPSGVFAGDLEKSHVMAAEYLKKFVDIKLPQIPDIAIICPGLPLSCDLYQGVKALISMHKVINKDTVAVLYGDFPEAMNSEDFPKPLRLFEDLDEAKKFTWDNYRIQMDHTLPIIDLLKLGVRTIVCTDTVSDEDIAALRMIKEPDLDKAVEMAFKLCGKENPKVVFCPHPQKADLSLDIK